MSRSSARPLPEARAVGAIPRGLAGWLHLYRRDAHLESPTTITERKVGAFEVMPNGVRESADRKMDEHSRQQWTYP
ncbi:hypothetical protein J7E83_18445 [Arthrobacter sp. ISL-48]|uniref:hypothetical protein n=1 Tax=Arthrobacter sp. ISL-48 TaxID=2819110 RepID=UPI001BE93EC4|nr:hypothetical protein [Arthrobacter sp. ISL-48]MBT2534068.1 hypothetical protein [Arthrobacter sp. ISL-48]